MKIVCPNCQAQYQVPEVVLTSRRKMRCARCGNDWVPADDEAALAAPLAPDLPPVVQPAAAAAAQEADARAPEPPTAIPPAPFPAARREPPAAQPAAPSPVMAPPGPETPAVSPSSALPQATIEHEIAALQEPDLSWTEPPPAPLPEADKEVFPAHLVETAAEPARRLDPEPIAAAPPPRPPVPRAFDTPVPARPRLPDPAAIVVPPVRRGPPVVEWVVSIALVAGLIAAGVMFRGPIMKAWPPSARLYGALGEK